MSATRPQRPLGRGPVDGRRHRPPAAPARAAAGPGRGTPARPGGRGRPRATSTTVSQPVGASTPRLTSHPTGGVLRPGAGVDGPRGPALGTLEGQGGGHLGRPGRRLGQEARPACPGIGQGVGDVGQGGRLGGAGAGAQPLGALGQDDRRLGRQRHLGRRAEPGRVAHLDVDQQAQPVAVAADQGPLAQPVEDGVEVGRRLASSTANTSSTASTVVGVGSRQRASSTWRAPRSRAWRQASTLAGATARAASSMSVRGGGRARSGRARRRVATPAWSRRRRASSNGCSSPPRLRTAMVRANRPPVAHRSGAGEAKPTVPAAYDRNGEPRLGDRLTSNRSPNRGSSTQATSKRSRFMTLSHAATKSRTNFSLASSQA